MPTVASRRAARAATFSAALASAAVVGPAAFLAPSTALAQQAEATPVYRQIKDWLLVCDNTRRCEARGLVDNEPAAMRVLRNAGPDEPITISIQGPGKLNARNLRRDGGGERLQQLPWQIVDKTEDYEGDLLLSGAPAREVLIDIRDASQLALGPTADNASISLIGLNAVLLAMDEVQGRLNTPGALIRTGQQEERRVHPMKVPPLIPTRSAEGPPVDPTLVKSLRQSRVVAMKNQCDATLTDPRDHAEPLGADEALVFLECTRGAYQSWFLDYRVKRDSPQTAAFLTLPAPAGASMLGETGLPEVNFDAATGSLVASAKGRGIGDCGYVATWQFDGREFQLTEYREQRICGGQGWDWPVWYRSRSQGN